MHCDVCLYLAKLFDVEHLAGRICSMNNGGCSHVCVDEPWGALCACPVGYKLSANGAVCQGVWGVKIRLFSL